MSSEHNGIYMLPSLEGLDEKKEKGRGSYGAVYEVKLNGLPCIAKGIHIILLDSQVSSGEQEVIRRKFFEECLMLSSLRHPNIVQFLGVHQRKENTYLVMEYMHMPLEQCLKEYPDIPLPFKTSIAQDVSYGLLHLHSLHPPIIHRDLSASNILLTEGMRAKIADLGVSKAFDLQWLHKISGQTIQPGTLAYMPPEALTEKPVYDLKLDIFSFGALLLYIATHCFPVVYEVCINDKTREAIENQTLQILRRKCWIELMGEKHPFYLVVIQCLQDRPEARPTTLALNETISRLHSKQTKEWKNILELHLQLKTSKVQLQKATSAVENLTSECQKLNADLKTSRAELELRTSEARSYKDQLDITQNEHQKLLTEKQQLSTELKDKKTEYFEKQKQLEDEIHGWSRAVYDMEIEIKDLKKKQDDKPMPTPKPRSRSNTATEFQQLIQPLQSDPQQSHQVQSHQVQSECAPQVDITITLEQKGGIEVITTPSLNKLPEKQNKATSLTQLQSVMEENSSVSENSSQSQKKTPEHVIIPSDDQNKVQQKAKEEDKEIENNEVHKPAPAPKPRPRSITVGGPRRLLPAQHCYPQLSHQVHSQYTPPCDVTPFDLTLIKKQNDGTESNVAPPLHKSTTDQGRVFPLPQSQSVIEEHSSTHSGASSQTKKKPIGGVPLFPFQMEQKPKDESTENVICCTSLYAQNVQQKANQSATPPSVKPKPIRH